VLVTCSRPVDASLHAALLVAAGAPPSQFIPPQTLLWLLPAASVHRVAAVPGVVCPPASAPTSPSVSLSLTHTHTRPEPSSAFASAIRIPSLHPQARQHCLLSSGRGAPLPATQAIVQHMQPAWKAAPSLAAAAAVAAPTHPLRPSGHALLQLSLVHSWGDRHAATTAARTVAVAQLLRRMREDNVVGQMWAAPHTPIVSVAVEHVNATVQWLTQQEVVHSVGLAAHYAPRNKQARWVVQSGEPATMATPLWDRGLRGAGQLVGVSDTGFDLANCLLNNGPLAHGRGTTQLCTDCTLVDFYSPFEWASTGNLRPKTCNQYHPTPSHPTPAAPSAHSDLLHCGGIVT
jgi:hypothetical protein